MLSEDIAKLMSMIPLEEVQAKTEGKDHIKGKVIHSNTDHLLQHQNLDIFWVKMYFKLT